MAVSNHMMHMFQPCYKFCCILFQVDLKREYVFRNSKASYEGVPVMASNMDTVGTFEMAKQLAKVIDDYLPFTSFFNLLCNVQ